VPSACPATSLVKGQRVVGLLWVKVTADPDCGAALLTFTGDLLARFNAAGSDGHPPLYVLSCEPHAAQLLERVPLVGRVREA